MSKKTLLLAITNGFWLIDPERATNYGPLVARILSGESAFAEDTEKENKEIPLPCLAIDDSGAVTFAERSESNVFNKAKPGSVAVISISGPIMKQDNCGDPGTESYGAWIKQADSNPNIKSIVLKFDTPGGSVDGTEALSNIVANTKKPVVSLVDNLMASAGYWIGSSANYIMAANKTSEIGSIGTMASFADMQPMWEKMGVKFHSIYATESIDKNAAFADARKGNYEKLKAEILDPINNIFMSAVKTNRVDKLNLKKENVLSGKVYLAEDAIKHGLIDSIGSLDDAIQKASELADEISKESQTNQPQMKKLSVFAAALVSFLSIKGHKDAGEQTSLTEDQLTEINSELATMETLKAEKTKAETDLVTANAKIAELEAAVTKLGGESAGETKTIKTETDKIEESANDEFLTSVDKERIRLKQLGI